MDTATEDAKKVGSFLVHDRSWKAALGISALAFLLLILLDSFLFAFAIGLVKIVLFVIGVVMLGRSVWLGYPHIKDKLEEK